MSLRLYSNCFLVLRNYTGMVVPRAFHSCWKLLAFNQIQLDACFAVFWRRFEATFKLRPVIPFFERNEMTECPRKPRQPTSTGINLCPFDFWRKLSFFFIFKHLSGVYLFLLMHSISPQGTSGGVIVSELD